MSRTRHDMVWEPRIADNQPRLPRGPTFAMMKCARNVGLDGRRKGEMPKTTEHLAWPAGKGDMATRVRTFDWTRTPLGPIETWPASLRIAVQNALDSGLPTYIWWGPDLIQIYNDATSKILRDRYPSALGQPARDVWADAWPVVGPLCEQVLATGEPITADDLPVELERNEASEIATFTFNYSALRDEDGSIAGMQAIAIETTEKSRNAAIVRRNEQQQAFSLDLSDALRQVTDPVDVQAIATRLLGERLEVDRAYYLEINEEEGYLRAERDFVRGDAPTMIGRYDLATFPWVGPTFRRGEPVVIDDAWTTPLIPDEERPAMDDIKVGAFIAVPLVREDQLVAALVVTNVAPRTWSQADIELLQATAERTWAAVEQARAEERLRRSEEQYRTLFNSIDEGFCIIEMIFADDGTPYDYRFLEVNPAFEQHTSMKNATGRTMRDFIPNHEQDWFDIYGRVAITGEPIRFVNESAGLGDRWFELHAFRIGQPDLRHVAVLFTDVTERLRAETSLRASEALFRGFAEASADTLWIVSAESGQLEYLSPAYERTWGEPRDRVMDDIDRWNELILEDDRAHADDFMARALAGETNVTDYRIIRPSDGGIRWIRDTSFPILSDDGRVTRAAGIAQDITEQKRIEEERQAFVDAAAHDLKTPLTSLRGQAQLLLRRMRRESLLQADALRPGLVEIDAAARRMVTVIDEMLDAAHLRAERMLDLRIGPTDLVALANAAAEDAQRSTNRHTVCLETDEESIVGLWDHFRLGRVLGNLLGNAIKFSPEGGDILINLHRETGDDGEGYAVISVEDRGIGIPEADMPKLFQRFRRGGNAARIPGTGIGLAGARQIVEQHGGTLTVSSEEGRGSIFVARLPLPSGS
jgi:PAS domain S-box-containing protein